MGFFIFYVLFCDDAGFYVFVRPLSIMMEVVLLQSGA